MPPLPTMSLRADPQHHPLIREVARALRDQPDLADMLRDVLQRNAQCGASQRNTQHDETQRIAYDDVLQRVANLEDAMRNATQRIAELESSQHGASRAHHVDPAEEYGQTAALAPTPLEEAIAAAEVSAGTGENPQAPELGTGANESCSPDLGSKTEEPLKDARGQLTTSGVRVFREMVAAGATTKVIADRFGAQTQNVARMKRRYLGEGA